MTFIHYANEFAYLILRCGIGYYFFVNTIFLVLIVVALHSIEKQTRVRPIVDGLRESFPSFAPSISVLAPAYNEQGSIVASVKSFLMLTYPSYELIVINDGSKDETLAKLIESFHLEKITLPYDATLSSTEIRGTYRSKIHPNLTVIDKANGGKADALNVGLGYSKFEIFCAVDSDSILEENALLKVAMPFMESPDETIASGGTIRIVNGVNVKYGRVESVGLPKNFLVLMQIIEYTRAFLCGRIGWNVFNSTLVISGAFGLFSRKAVLELGGYQTGSIGEDMDLVVRLHRKYRELKQKYSIVFIPDPVCWTEAPSDVASLQKQRSRWQRGLADTLKQNRTMIFNPRYGFLGLFAFPYFLFVELLGPVFEVLSLLAIVILLCTEGSQHISDFSLYFVVGLLYGAILSICSVVIEEVYFCKYDRARQFLTLFVAALVESILYRPLSSFWRISGLFTYLRGDKSWGQIKRIGLP